MGSMEQTQKLRRKSILHVQNVFLTNPINIYYKKETGRYIIGYEPKRYRYHSLVIKLDKKLISNINKFVVHEISIKEPLDINIKYDYRLKAKQTDVEYLNGIRTVMRIVQSRYASIYNPLYCVVLETLWKHTGKGGVIELEFDVPECPTIVNSSVIDGICYKLIATQRSFGGTHGMNTYVVLSNRKGQYTIGKSIRIPNLGKHYYESPVTVNL